jgi:surfactin synthase thioesterase subunit
MRDSGTLLLCLPFAGAGASIYRNWPRRLGDLEICPVQLPGRENRLGEAGFDTLEQVGREAAAALGSRLDRPFALFGHCMGALLAYSMLEALEERGGPLPQRFFASAARAPSDGFFSPIHPNMPDPVFEAHVREAIQRFGEPSPMEDLVRLGMITLRKDLLAFQRYSARRQNPLPCPITAFAWSDDATVSESDMAGWNRWGAVRSITLPGDHFAVLGAPPAFLSELSGHTLGAELGNEVRFAKLRGRTIDLFEIEAALRGCDNVGGSAVLAAGSDRDERIVAFVVSSRAALLPHELRQTIRRTLPNWMIPSEFVQVSALPETAQGGVDRKVLSGLLDKRAQRDGDYLAPQNWAEELVIAAWEDHLPADRVGADDNFFALGGNSLVGAQICRALESGLGVRLGLTTVLQRATPRELAEEILKQRPVPVTPVPMAGRPEERVG